MVAPRVRKVRRQGLANIKTDKFFSVLLRSLCALSFKAQATTSSRGHRLTQPTRISGLGGWDPGDAGRIASAATDSSRGAGGGCVGSLGAARRTRFPSITESTILLRNVLIQ